ncbi:CDP-alcohol phosphatidyltransferase family protein [Conexibacter sp. DBS9H8]|uniref:CDP-alcohol phosphatidyltransferase family protein n=1 Tax=Conexibacter sp. DBS9H8 TaxID=2937801 RepID=UPI0020109DAD|nr:CDP-alcohol phosphatidyltransferase family protein [Conexibacter sp. DBS9H8]
MSAATAGEQWAADALTDLRRDGFAPAAVGRFLTRSVQRARESRLARPDLARQSLRWQAIGTLLLLAVRERAVAGGRPQPTRAELVTWLVLVGRMLDWHLGMLESDAGVPRERLDTADALMLGRAAIAPFIAAAPPDADTFMALIGAGALSDLLDGRLARRRGPTRLGRDFDSLADSAFRIAAISGARRAGWIGPTVTRLHLARQSWLGLGAAWQWFGHSTRPAVPEATVRWHVPLLLGGLAVAPCHRRTGELLIATGLLWATAAPLLPGSTDPAGLPSSSGTLAAWSC